MWFLEICYVTALLIIISQVVVPMLWPKQFRLFWLFRKKSKQPEVVEAVNEVLEENENLQRKVGEVLDKTMQDLEEAKQRNDQVKQLKSNKDGNKEGS